MFASFFEMAQKRGCLQQTTYRCKNRLLRGDIEIELNIKMGNLIGGWLSA